MALALLIIGFMLASVGIQGTQGDLAKLVAADFSGAGNFWYFVLGVFLVGSLGYYAPMQTASRAFIALILVVWFLSNKGFWAELQKAIQNPVPAPSAPPAKPQPITAPGAPVPGVPTPREIMNNPGSAIGIGP